MKQIKSRKRVKDFGEVYTQPREVNAMLDLVKEESYRTDSLFLEPACGNGNFLVEILKRKLTVAQNKEEVTTSLSSIYAIDILEDNIVESKKRLYELVKDNLTQEEAFFIMNQNIVCGDSLELLNHSPYIDMKFDVVIGNPPYQLSDSEVNFGASPFYHKFVQQAKKLNPKFITMIIPSRWTITGKGLDEFRREMLNDRRLGRLVDYYNSEECFSGVNIGGGICYFLWDSNHDGDCHITTINALGSKDTTRPLLAKGSHLFIRDSNAVSIINKIKSFNEESFSNIVSPSNPFGFRTFFKGDVEKKESDDVLIYHRGGTGYVRNSSITKNKNLVAPYKVLTTRVYGDGGKTCPNQVINKIFVIERNTCCSETYLILGHYDSYKEAINVVSYAETKFFRFLVSLIKITQDNSAKIFELVPMQDFSKPWTDAELYEKYGLTQEEIDYIESMIRPMK